MAASVMLTPGSARTATFLFEVNRVAVPAGPKVAATAMAAGDTSEFSTPKTVTVS